MSSPVRVRFAPSPTGFLHVGGARTAIFNWLFARHHGGTFVLRIEDTDRQRSSQPMVQAILDGMEWLGLEPDEGPHYQAQAIERHTGDAAALLEGGKAYRCFCPQDELRRQREAAPKDQRDWIYPGTCRDLDPSVSARRAAAGESFAVRFKVPRQGRVGWNDDVHGETSFAAELIEDFVILRSDGTPTYMLSVVSDDAAMEITHVIRGDDHLSNTPKQILLYEALDRPTPAFAHLPLILGDDKKRLSKRHGAVSVLSYRDQGYMADAMFNFLTLLGWSPGDDRQALDREELIRCFSLDAVGKSGAIFDLTKLDWLNGHYLRAMPPREIARRVRPLLEEAGLWRDGFDGEERSWFLATLALLQPRARRLSDLVETGRSYLDPADDFPYDEKAEKKHLKGEGLCSLLAAWAAKLRQVEPFEAEPLEAALRALAEERGVGAGKLIHPTRLALTGQGVSPGIFEVLQLLGRERSVRRLERLIAHLRARAAG